MELNVLILIIALALTIPSLLVIVGIMYVTDHENRQ
jgi:hypothetical protein